MYPISDLTAFCRQTTGDVPPKLVGASTTVVGSKMYLYGGRLVSERKMVSDIYMFDLETFRWERVAQSSDDDIPQARYFHSADTWRNYLIIFGGMAIKPQSDNPEDLCVLNDVRLFDLTSRHWLPAAPIAADSSLLPNARYAHLSSVTADRLFIIGGQDLANVWLDDVYIFDLVAKTWIQRRDYPRHCGTYRSVAVTSDQRVRLPQEELRAGQPSTRLGQPGTRFNLDGRAAAAPNATPNDSLIHLPYSAAPTDDYPCDIFLFSNYNFTDVQRELEVFTPLSEGDFTVSDRSSAMTGTSFPPGLRFPTGAILGTFFIVAGTYLSQTYQSFSIWALDLINMTWSRIDPGSALSTGSWFRSCLWASANKFVVFGNRHGNLVEDYNRRLLSWDHVTCIDLEAFGIYQPPPLYLDIPMQELGLAALEEGLMTDFEIICDDGRRIKVSRKLLEDRWPWFKEQRKMFLQAASRALENMPVVPTHIPPPELPNASRQEQRPDPRLTSRTFNLSEPYPITFAFMQYFYSMSLITPLQHAPAVLSQLLLLSSTYQLTHLQSLVKHAMHRALSYATSVGIYGVSTLCSCRSLQIRALRVVMAYSQRRPAGVRPRPDTRPDRDGGGAQNSDGSGGSGRLDPATVAARPRGMSDASYMRGASEASNSNSRGFARRVSTAPGSPLSALTDLQELGLHEQEWPVPPTHHSFSKRTPNAAIALPPRSEEPFPDGETPVSTPSASACSPLPAVPLPSVFKLGSFDTLVPLDDQVSLKTLPVPYSRRMTVTDTLSSESSLVPRREREQLSSLRKPSPVPLPNSSPHASVLSLSTEQDLFAIVDILSPSVDVDGMQEEPIPEGPPMPELEPFPDMFPDDLIAARAFNDSPGPSLSSIYSAYGRQSTGSRWMRSSLCTDLDSMSCYSDDMPDVAHLARLREGFHEFQLRGSLPPPLDDSRSIASSGASSTYNSPRTPSLSRTPSLACLASPPISPASFSSPSEASGSSSPPIVGQWGDQNSRKLLGIVEEAFQSEDSRSQRRHTTDGAGLTHMHTRSADHSLYRSSSRSDLRGSPRCDSRNELRSASRSESRTRRLSDLQKLQISESSPSHSPTSAPAPEVHATSPFIRLRPTYLSLTSRPRPSPFIQTDSRRSSYSPTASPSDERSSYTRDWNLLLPLGRLRTTYSQEHLPSAYTSEMNPPSPPSSGWPSEHDQTPSIPLVPLSPSANSGAKSRHSLGKLFRRSGAPKKQSDESVVAPSSQSVSSLDLSLSKTDERRMRKEVARARTERLAQDLAEKARRRALQNRSQKGVYIKEKSKRPWEEGGGLYEGISYF